MSSMMNNIEKQLQEIKKELSQDLEPTLHKITQLQSELKTVFNQKVRQFLKENNYRQKIKVPKSPISMGLLKGKQIEIPINWRYLLSAPFIYGMFFPSVIFHLGLEIYHQICFRLYGIPLVRSKEYFIYDRQLMSWLSTWEKINCYYCSYVNNLIRYAVEIGGRTERYWCPIKYYRRINNQHSQYGKFVDIRDSKKLREHWQELRDFSDIEPKHS